MEKSLLAEKIKSYLGKNKLDRIMHLLEEHHPADIAEIFRGFEAEESIAVLKLLDADTAGLVVNELDPEVRGEILSLLRPEFISRLMEAIPTEDAADIFGEMPPQKADEALSMMEEEDAEEVEELLQYPPESAGGIMTPGVFALPEDTTVESAISELRNATELESISYLYVTDEEGRLTGVISLRDLITSEGSVKIKDIMKADVVSAGVDTDQEEVARLVRKYNFRSLPVVDSGNVLLGRVTADEVMDVIQEEADEDIFKMAGVDDDERLAGKNIVGIVRLRLPWLISPLIAGLGAAYIIKGFEETLAAVIAVAFFIPVIMDMGGNVGTQSAAIVVRGIATGRIHLERIWELLFREMRIAMIIGSVCGLLTGLLGMLLHGSAVLGIVVMVSMFLALSLSSTIGAFLPVALKRFNVDPAIASGPFVTTVNDIVCLVIYFFLASRSLAHLGG